MFSNGGSYHTPQNILDNYYSVYSGAGMTWYKLDIWYQYMAGSSMFYHEQGFDEFWQPGGTTVAGIKTVQLSPKGKLVERFTVEADADDDAISETAKALPKVAQRIDGKQIVKLIVARPRVVNIVVKK